MTDSGVEEKLLDQYGGKGTGLPQTLSFDHVSPATRLLEKRRQMFEVQEALNSQKEEFARREDAFRRREETLRRKDIELQESLIKFNKFLQENESKRNRALKRCVDEKKQRELKEIEIKKLEDQLKNKLQDEQVLKKKAERHAKYHDYLENVISNMSKFFAEINDVLNRHKTLQQVNEQLILYNSENEVKNESTLREYISFRKEKENELLAKNNDIAKKQDRLENCKIKSAEDQGELDLTTQAAAEKTLALGQILSSVKNILNRCEESFGNRHNKPKVDRSSDRMERMALDEQVIKTKMKLDEISMFMVDYRDIIDEYQAEFGRKVPGSAGYAHGTMQQSSSTGAPPTSADAKTSRSDAKFLE